MSDTYEPLFGVVEQAARHASAIREIFTVAKRIAKGGAMPTPNDHDYNAKNGYYTRTQSGDTRLVCGLTRHTHTKDARSLLVHRTGYPHEHYDKAIDLLDRQDALARTPQPNAALYSIHTAAWYFEQRAWSQYALDHHRRTNHWLMMNPDQLRLMAGIVGAIGDRIQGDGTWFGMRHEIIDMDDLMPGMTMTQIDQARLISRHATQSDQSLMQFIEALGDNLPNIVINGKHVLKVAAHTSRGHLSMNVAGNIADNLHYQQGNEQIILDKSVPTSAITGMIGRPLKEVVDLPWIGEETRITDARIELDRLKIMLKEEDDKTADGVVIGQVLPKEARPGRPLGWEKD